jgi:hypothetical protein
LDHTARKPSMQIAGSKLQIPNENDSSFIWNLESAIARVNQLL